MTPPRGANTSRQKRASAHVHTLPPTRYLFFGGKGGVGKTSAACAAALLLLERAAPGEQILLFSTDPAHSLSDSLGVEIGDRLVEVARAGAARGDVDNNAPRLFAREMDATRALTEFKNRHRAVLKEIADRGTLLDESDINELLDLSLPGMDEVMSLFELSEVERAARFARVVVDTAPSGHTTRLLRLPEVFTRWIAALDRMAEKHRFMVAHFARGGRRAPADEVDLFLAELSERVRSVRAMLFDPARTTFTLVAIPEALSVEETARYHEFLVSEGVPVKSLVVNRVEQEHDACRFCRARVSAQARWLTALAERFASLDIRRVPLLPNEVRGAQALRRFASLAWETTPAKTASGRATKQQDAPALRRPDARASRGDRHAFAFGDGRLLIFGGKGGVGKTTAAASAALALAEGDARRRVLVFSTDPAHSLSDSFHETVGEHLKGIGGLKNLDAMEIDPAARFEELKERYRRWTDELFATLTGGSRWEVQFDREAMREMVALAPPGIDEIAALSAVSDLLERETYSTIVLDTAPTGHLIRFLELPEIALSWVRTFIKLLLKYKDVVRWGGVAEELIALSKSIKRVAALLTDARECEFVAVAIPERMSLEETERLARSLASLRVPLRRLLINNVVTTEAARACDFCAARRRAQQATLKLFRRRFRNEAEIFLAPQQPHEIRGLELLRAHFAVWTKDDTAKKATGQKAKR
ncbi:MAG TPA: ArsA family ATPase [Pyrinomonadaceae bacterium]|nr:ArsA family ATPase [Pyrinomonadaceae bacterium]